MSTKSKLAIGALVGTGYVLGRTRPVEKVRDHLHDRIIEDNHGGAIPSRGPQKLRHAVGWFWLISYGVAFPEQGWKLLTKKRTPGRPVAEKSIGINPAWLAKQTPVVRVDFNEINGEQVHALVRLLDFEPTVGTKVMATDEDGEACPGVISEVGEISIAITLSLDEFVPINPT